MAPTPVLLLTHDDLLWQRWREIDPSRWQPARGSSLTDLARWQEKSRGMIAIIDTDLPRLPAWPDPSWRLHTDRMRLVAATPHPTDEEGTRVLAAGFGAYCHAYGSPAMLSQILEVVASGQIWLGRSLMSRLLRMVDSRTPSSEGWHHARLTARENAVALRAATGESNQAIGQALGITERTVKAHMSAVFEKLGLNDRLQLALLVHGINQPQAAPHDH